MREEEQAGWETELHRSDCCAPESRASTEMVMIVSKEVLQSLLQNNWRGGEARCSEPSQEALR